MLPVRTNMMGLLAKVILELSEEEQKVVNILDLTKPLTELIANLESDGFLSFDLEDMDDSKN